MKPRQRHATGRSGPGSATAVLEPPRPAAASAQQTSSLDDFLHQTSSAQRDDFLALARRQGFVYAHQVPLPSNGHRPAGEETGHWNQLNHLLAGHADLAPACDAAFEPVDQALDGRQRQAVARALGTPDLALIVGWPGTGKSRVVAEILTQAALRGERALLVAPHAAAIDRVLGEVAPRDAVYPARLLEPGERFESLPPLVQALTLPQRAQHLKEQVLSSARRCQEAAESQCRQRRQEELLWPRLEKLTEQAEDLLRRRQDLDGRQSRVLGEIEAEFLADSQSPSSPSRFAREVRTGRRRHDEALAQWDAEHAQTDKARDEAQQRRAALEAERATLQPLAEAKRRRRWWTWMWWRATFRGKVPARFAQLESEYQQALQAQTSAEQQLEKLERLRKKIEEDHTVTLDRLRSEEIARRRQLLSLEAAPLQQAYEQMEAQWQEVIRRLEPSVRPANLTSVALDAAHLDWQNRRHHDEEQCNFAERWSTFLQNACGPRGERLLSLINLVAGTTQALMNDRHFGADEPFDLLVVEEADQITEADFLKLARRARRWVLVGEPAWEYVPPTGRDRAGLPGPFAFLQKLWQLLHWEPRRLPPAWAFEGQRLCCRLRPVPSEQRRWLESEPLSDAPEVTLRILNLPRAQPLLAEIVFPPTTTLAEAKHYVYRELQEVPVDGHGRHATLREDSDRWLLHLGDERVRAVDALDLGGGVRECLLPLENRGCNGDHTLPRTYRFEFAKSAGWSAATVMHWARAQLHYRDLGRTARLEVLHRPQPELAHVVSNLLFSGEAMASRPATGATATTEAFRLIPVPPLRPRQARLPQDRRSSADSPLPREGAGLEQDLSLPRHGDCLPNDLRPHLPTRGIVNFLEAQALVRALEDMIGHGRGSNGKESAPSIVVIAFSAAQVELIRLLVRRSPLLKAAKTTPPIGLPGAFGHQEFDRVLLSLARSHGHRAVAFAEQFRDVILALSRARQQVVVFADAGTLLRRSEFSGRVEHLDEAASAREARLAADLLKHLRQTTPAMR